MAKKHEITIVNPKPGKKPKKKRSAKKVPRKKPTKRRKPTTKRRRTARRRKRNPRATPVPRARNPRRRRRAPGRRRNPTFGGMLKIDLRDDLAYSLWRMGGKLAVAFAVRRWGDAGEANPTTGVASATTGERWGFKNLLIGWLASAVTGELGARFFGADRGQKIYDGGVDLLTTKMFWSEIVHRLGGSGGAAMFGATDDMNALAQQAGEGDVMDDGEGNRWLLQNGQWVAMQGEGMGDELDDELYSGLETATPLDALQEATDLDGGDLGHLMDPGAPSASLAAGRYSRRGSQDPYHASYL